MRSPLAGSSSHRTSAEAFKEALDHPLVNILMATIEGWTEA
ncbi:hypothetical protein [Moorena sp. SIO3A2]|nr:hypothetical protein [Moorena sp. SIO3A2]